MKQKSFKDGEMDTKMAQEITEDFATFIGKTDINNIYNFQEILPWGKSDILRALCWLIVRSENTQHRDVLAFLISELDSFGPNPEEYTKLVDLKKFTDDMPKIMGKA